MRIWYHALTPTERTVLLHVFHQDGWLVDRFGLPTDPAEVWQQFSHQQPAPRVGPARAQVEDVSRECYRPARFLLRDEDVCPVCFEEFSVTLRSTKPCGHLFHKDCLQKWLSDHTTCPSCRAELSN